MTRSTARGDAPWRELDPVALRVAQGFQPPQLAAAASRCCVPRLALRGITTSGLYVGGGIAPKILPALLVQ